MSGFVRRSTGTAIETTMKANSVPMLTRSARALSGTSPARIATNTMVPAVMRYGVPHFGWILATAGGSSRSRPIAKPIRPMARMSTRMTDVSPQMAAIETSLAAQLRPTCSKALAIGAPSLIRSYFTIPVSTNETPM